MNQRPVESHAHVSNVPGNSIFFGIMRPNFCCTKGRSLIKDEIVEYHFFHHPKINFFLKEREGWRQHSLRLRFEVGSTSRYMDK